MAFKINNEVKIGLLTTITILIFILGFNYLRGKGIFSNDKEYFTYYDNIQGLQESAVVLLQGYAIGKVSDIELQPDRRIKVTFTLKKNIQIPEGSSAQLASNDLISGTKIINMIIPDTLPTNVRIMEEGSYLPSMPSNGIFDNLSDQVSPLVNVIQHTVISLDSLLNSVNYILNEDARIHLNSSLQSLDKGMQELAALSTNLNKQTDNLAGILKNANSITGNIASKNESINSTLSNLEQFSKELSAAPIKTTLDELQKTSTNLNGIVDKINNSNGSVGLLLSDPKLYHNLTGTLGALDTLMTDLKQHPSKYINVSVFGRKVKD